jgi:hypothetical protein
VGSDFQGTWASLNTNQAALAKKLPQLHIEKHVLSGDDEYADSFDFPNILAALKMCRIIPGVERPTPYDEGSVDAHETHLLRTN